jgi:uncharacterized membrane protein HdeD (DUF308 family)
MIITDPFTVGSWTREQIDRVSRGWWVLAATGVISVVAGGIILFTDWTLDDLAFFVGAFLVFRGIFTAMGVPVDGAVRQWSLGLGLLEVAIGITVWAWPGPTLLVLAGFIGWWVLFSGVVTIAGAITGRGILPYWGLTLAFGILETLISFRLLARPGLTLVAATMAIGLWSVILGVIQLVLAFEVKHLAERAGREIGFRSVSP